MSNDTTTASNRPGYTAYSVRDYETGGERKSQWNPIGIAWAHKDGNGFDVILDAVPVNGKIAIRRSKPRPKQT